MGTKALIEDLKTITDMAYSTSADFIKGKINELKNGAILPDYEVESIYDMLLDLCFDQRFAALFEELKIATAINYPLLTEDYSRAFRQLWQEG